MLSAILKLTPHNLSGCALAALTLLSRGGISESWNAVAQFSKQRTSTATTSTCLPMSMSTSTSTTATATPSFTVAQFPCRQDNYGFLIHDSVSGVTAAVDTPCAKAYNKELQKRGWKLTHILNTHHHNDHVGGNLELKSQGGVTIIGPINERDAIPGLDQTVGGGHTVQIGTLKAMVLDVGGHTAGHIAYHFPEQGVAFVGDSLFALGCGRMFEGTPTQFWASLQRLRDLPDETLIYCAHEYTEANAKFAMSVEPGNMDLVARVGEVKSKRSRGEPTVPTVLRDEKKANPFLRVDVSEELRNNVGVTANDSDSDAFAKVRKAKDNF